MPPKEKLKVSGKAKQSKREVEVTGTATSSSTASSSTSSGRYNTSTGKIKISQTVHLDPPVARAVVGTKAEDMVASTVQTTQCIRYRVGEPKLEPYTGKLIEGKRTQTEFGRIRLNCNISLDSAKLQLLSSLSHCMLWYLEGAEGNSSFVSSSSTVSSVTAVGKKGEPFLESLSPMLATSSTSAPTSGAMNKHAEVQIGLDDNGLYVASNAGAIGLATYLAMIDTVKRLPLADPDDQRPLTRAVVRIQELFGADEVRHTRMRIFLESQEKKNQERVITRARRASKMSEQELDEIASGELLADIESERKTAVTALDAAVSQSHWYRNVVATIGQDSPGGLANLYQFLKVLREGTGIEQSRANVNDASWAGTLPILHAELRVVRAAWLTGSGNLLLGGAKRACWSCNSVLRALDVIATRPIELEAATLVMTGQTAVSSTSSVTASSSTSPRAPHVPQLFNILRLIDDDIPGGAFPDTYCGVLDPALSATAQPGEMDLSTNLTRRRSVIRFV